jgi:rubrerythrin
MGRTDDDLKAAFAGESQANRKYLAFAKKADEEGKPQIAKLFRAAAAAEAVHALNHLRAMGGIRSTKENLEESIAGESFEFMKMYPEYLKEARNEGNTRATSTFDMANKVEEIHHALYGKALAALGKGEDLPSGQIWVCQVCGNTVEGSPPDRCPICGAPRQKFIEADATPGAERSVIC